MTTTASLDRARASFADHAAIALNRSGEVVVRSGFAVLAGLSALLIAGGIKLLELHDRIEIEVRK